MTRGRQTGLWVYIVAVTLAGTGAYQMLVVPLAQGQGVSWPWLVAVTCGFFAAERWVVHLRLGREAFAFSMMELPLVLGLFFVRPDVLVAGRLLGSLAAWLWQRKPAQKVLFNAGLFTLETSVAVVIWYAVVGGAEPLGPAGGQRRDRGRHR